MSWSEYELFISVARHGGLSGASAATGVSPATIGRRMLALEEAVGRPLFIRSRLGYKLTPDGEALLARTAEMERVASSIGDWLSSKVDAPLVRIACGTWFAWLLAQHLPAIRSGRESVRLQLLIGERRARLAHRESDIGIRAFRPTEPNLATKQLGEVAYAAYRARNAKGSAVEQWIAVAEEDAFSGYLRWPHEHRSDQIKILVNRPRSMLDLAISGAGTAVLPCFVGDQDMRLERAGEEILSLRHTQWIVMNDEDRHRPEIRLAAGWLVKLVEDRFDLFAGRYESI